MNSTPQRIESLDQFRGYAVLGMIFVNYVGNFDAMPDLFKHNRYSMSYADTIAPVFMFVVGMGFRLSLIRHIQKVGPWRARWAAIKRYTILICVGIVLYGITDYRVSWWDALVDIGFAGLLALPFIERSARARIMAAVFYLTLFQVLSLFGYYEWTMSNSIDGGPLGPLSWVFILLMGTLAYDLLQTQDTRKIATWSLAVGIGLFIAGWLLKLEWPGMKTEWPYTQRGMTAPYPISSTGLCFLTFLAFHYLGDRLQLRIPHLSTLGHNALTIYIVQQVLLDMNGTVVPEATAIPAALLGFAAFYLICYAVAWRLHRDNIVIRL